jgi:hypothetical protein
MSSWFRPINPTLAPDDADVAGEGSPPDLLRAHSRLVAVGLLVLAVGIFAGSFAYGSHSGLPTVALDWLFGLQVIRGAVVFAIFALLIVLLIRGWGGLWPQRITTTSIEFPEIEAEVAKHESEVSELLGQVILEVRALKAEAGQD